MKIGMVICGTPSWYPAGIVDLIISGYKNFVESNSALKLNLVKSYNPALQDSEFVHDGSGCYFPYPGSLLPSTVSKFPSDAKCNILLYDWKGKSPCYGGGTWGYGVNNIPFTAIPLGPWSDELNTWDGWTYSKTQTLVHEWLHELDIIFERSGYTSFRSSDDCDEAPYNYNDQTDQGWQTCYKRMLSEITPEMYTSLGETTTKITCSSNQINMAGTCVDKGALIIGITGFVMAASIVM